MNCFILSNDFNIINDIINENDLYEIVDDLKKRDIEIIINSYSSSAIILKNNSLIMKLDFFRIIIKYNKAYFFNTNDKNLNDFLLHLNLNLHVIVEDLKQNPFEFIVLELILM